MNKIIPPDFLQIPYQIFSDERLDKLDGYVYAVVYWFDKLKDGKCTASNVTIASVVGSSAASVANSLMRLENGGYIKRLFRDEKRRVRKQIKCLVSYKKVSSTDETVSSTDETYHSSTDEEKKNTINKKRKEYSASRVKEIQDLMDLFYQFNPALKFNNTTERKACEEMIEKWDFEKVKHMAIKVISVQGTDKFAPRASTPSKMWNKIAEFAAYFKAAQKTGKVVRRA